MIQTVPTVTAPLLSVILKDYRLAVEQEYCATIVRLLRSGQEQLQIESLIREGLPSASRDTLDSRLGRYTLDSKFTSIDRFTIELEVCHSLLYYLQAAKHIRHQGISLVGQAILDHERARLDLSQQTADQINSVVFATASPRRSASDPRKLAQYDQHLFTAIRQDGIPLKETTQAELKLLQRVLEIADSDIPPPEKLRSAKGIDYIRLWRLLKQQNWKAANAETHQRLVEAGGQQVRDLELIDVERIPTVDLRTIDTLWREHSKERFGFKVQLGLWQTVQPNLEALGKSLDWRRNNSWISYDFIDFSSHAAHGHLPAMPHLGWWCWVGGMAKLMARVEVAYQEI